MRRLADRILLFEDGRVVLDAPRDEALADPRLGTGYLMCERPSRQRRITPVLETPSARQPRNPSSIIALA